MPQERFGDAPPLVHGQQHALAGRPAREQPVDAAGDQIPHERCERLVVQVPSAVPHRRHGRGDRSTQSHGGGVYPRRAQNTFRSASSVFATGFSAIRRMNHGYQYGPYAINVRTVNPSRASRRCSSERMP